MVYMYSRDSEKIHLEGFREYALEKPDCISASLVPEDQQYSDQVKEYSKRLLTFGSDEVNAFLGGLNSFGEHQYGLPNSIIDQAMLWHIHMTHLTRAQSSPVTTFLAGLGLLLLYLLSIAIYRQNTGPYSLLQHGRLYNLTSRLINQWSRCWKIYSLVSNLRLSSI
jgi:hypothetical protein